MESEDARKKRDCPEEEEAAAEQQQSTGEEKTKKLRADSHHAVVTGSNSRKDDNDNDESAVQHKSTTTRPAEATTTRDDSLSIATTSAEVAPVWDLETALHRLNGNDQDGSISKEYLSSDEHSWVTFRWAHAGDASTLAAWYRQSEDQVADDDNNNKTDHKTSPGIVDSSDKKTSTTEGSGGGGGGEDPLELWLADGLGDEDTPPAVMALLAHVVSSSSNNNDNNSRLGAVALLTLAWEEGKRLLRVEWCRVDPSLSEAELLGRRLWLRLSALALMTACQTLLMEESTFVKFSPSSNSNKDTRTATVAGTIIQDR